MMLRVIIIVLQIPRKVIKRLLSTNFIMPQTIFNMLMKYILKQGIYFIFVMNNIPNIEN